MCQCYWPPDLSFFCPEAMLYVMTQTVTTCILLESSICVLEESKAHGPIPPATFCLVYTQEPSWPGSIDIHQNHIVLKDRACVSVSPNLVATEVGTVVNYGINKGIFKAISAAWQISRNMAPGQKGLPTQAESSAHWWKQFIWCKWKTKHLYIS